MNDQQRTALEAWNRGVAAWRRDQVSFDPRSTEGLRAAWRISNLTNGKGCATPHGTAFGL